MAMAVGAVGRNHNRSRSPHKSASLWPKGTLVQFFLDADPANTHATYVCPTRAPGIGPRLLQSHGWLPATLQEDFAVQKFNPKERGTWPNVLPSSDLLFLGRPTGGDVGKLGTTTTAARRIHVDLVRAPSSEAPLLSLVFVRWGGEAAVPGVRGEEEANDGDWGQYGAPASDDYMSALVKKGLKAHPTLIGEKGDRFDFEVFSLFVRHSQDMLALADQASWVTNCLKGQKSTTFWMMWPAEWVDHGGADYAAYVNKANLFSAMRACEASGLRTGFPHPADQYELITSKAWMATLALQPEAALPAATLVSKANVLSDPTRAAKHALAALAYIRSKNSFAPGGPSAVNKDGIKKGVVKLGWSWEARYVLIFHSDEDLAVKLTQILTHSGCSANSCIVQEWVDFDYEMRLYFLPPDDWVPTQKLKPTRIECNAWSGSMDNGERRNFHKLSTEEVMKSYWENDMVAFKAAKKQATSISQFLLGWLQTCDAQPVPMIRLDFMLLRSGPGTVQVVFGEYCEMGACCLGWADGPPTIWRAALDRALQ